MPKNPTVSNGGQQSKSPARRSLAERRKACKKLPFLPALTTKFAQKSMADLTLDQQRPSGYKDVSQPSKTCIPFQHLFHDLHALISSTYLSSNKSPKSKLNPRMTCKAVVHQSLKLPSASASASTWVFQDSALSDPSFPNRQCTAASAPPSSKSTPNFFHLFDSRLPLEEPPDKNHEPSDENRLRWCSNCGAKFVSDEAALMEKLEINASSWLMQPLSTFLNCPECDAAKSGNK